MRDPGVSWSLARGSACVDEAVEGSAGAGPVELHIHVWHVASRTAESCGITMSSVEEEPLPCAQAPSAHMGDRQLTLMD